MATVTVPVTAASTSQSQSKYPILRPCLTRNKKSTSRIVIRAPIATWTGYTDHLRIMVTALLEFGHMVMIRATSINEHLAGQRHPMDQMLRQLLVHGVQPEPWEILLHAPFEKPTPGKKTVYFTMWETTALKKESVDVLNLAEVVVVPCDWNKHCFIESGVTKPIKVAHLGMNPAIYHYRPMPRNGPFVFGAAGRLMHGDTRKGVKEAVECFIKAFPDEPDVRLKVKCFMDDPIGRMPDDPRIELETRFLGIRQMAHWISTLNCFVALAKGEGWGAIQQQAMMIGRPVIASIYSGTEMFLTRENCYPVDYALGEPPKNNYYAGLGYWAIPDDDSAIAAMRSAYENRDLNEQLGLKAMADTSGLTHLTSNAKLVEVLDEFGVIE